MGIENKCTSINPFDPNNQLECKKEYEDLLKPVMRGGELVYSFPALPEVQSHTLRELECLPPTMERFLNPEPYFVGLEKSYYQKKIRLIQQLRKKSI